MTTEYLLRFDADPREIHEWCAKNFPTDALSFYSGWDHGKPDRIWRWRLDMQDKRQILLHSEKDMAWFLLRWS